MHDTTEIFHLLSIAKLAADWPNLRPIHDRAMEKLVAIAKEPAHTPPEAAPKPVLRGAPTPIRRDTNG